MIDLQQFCSTDDARPHLLKPFSGGRWTYASNGHIIIRLPYSADAAEAPLELAGKARDLFAWQNAPPEMMPLPTFNFPPGVGEKCPDCGGRGIEHSCPDCCCHCASCKGSGELGGRVSASIGAAIFDAKYLKLLSSLPDLRVAVSPPHGEAMPCVFDGGAAVLMSMKREHGTHIRAEPQP